MSMHPEYPALVQEALASDVYWSLPEKHSPQNMDDPAVAIKTAKDVIRVGRDAEVAKHIANVVFSMENGGIAEPIPYGEELPIPHRRQVLQVVEDSREIVSKVSPSNLIFNLITAYYQKKTLEYEKYTDPDFTYPSFGENLEKIHSHSGPGAPRAEITTNYSKTRLAILKRSIMYLSYDEASEQFAALDSSVMTLPGALDKGLLKLIPRTKVGTVYSKDPQQNRVGRIISAQLIEPTNVNWTNNQSSANGKKKTKAATSAAPGLSSHSVTAS